MDLVFGIWASITLILVVLAIWLPYVAFVALLLALTFIVAVLVALFVRQREQKEKLEVRLNRIEALLKGKGNESKSDTKKQDCVVS